ncbi:MAG: DUF512 domain-containing protein [Oscillospiraceae bacterium]|jgi:putative radical SAM enzyme (TIGR03279 family)|nr:DUF512 domain-containing protein [Oscillospiraceae bacterium]
MGVPIAGIKRNSPAHRAGIRPGDTLLSVNGNKITDVLDYRFYITDYQLSLVLLRGNRIFTRRLVNRSNEDLGLKFSTYLMDRQKSCKNKCIFCFIDQLPPGLRESLYFKDDDSRLSFLFGNYITLTNLSEHEINRIIAMHISPVNISVHTTNPELRCYMMNNRFAGERLSIMRRFANAGIRMKCQLVLCPGINDGQELERTMNDLADLVPQIESVAGVPVGLTKYRDSLPALRSFTKSEAADVVRQMEKMGEKMLGSHGMRVFYPADEFYLKAEIPLPALDYYGDFAQLENGVGLITLFCDEFLKGLEKSDGKPHGSRIILATGLAAAPFLNRLVDKARQKWDTLNVSVKAIENNFFGKKINVAGLVTGSDLIKQLENQKCDIILVPSVMLRREGDLFLDDVTIDDLQHALNAEVVSVPVDGSKLIDALML